MINLQELYEWRWQDKENGMVLPYYTRPCLDWLVSADLSINLVFEYGLGASSVWYNYRCMNLYGVDDNEEWFDAVSKEVGESSSFSLQKDLDKYPDEIYQWDKMFDLVVIDGKERDRCVQPALNRLNYNGVLIVDNWMQESADYMPDKKIQEQLLSMQNVVFYQPGHVDWKTLVVWK